MTTPFDDPGIYRSFQPYTGQKRPAVFLDRDGVIVEETGYLHNPGGVAFITGAIEAIGLLNHAGWPVIVVTNQAGVGRGYYGWPEFEAVQAAIEAGLAAASARLDGVWACAYHPEGVGALGADHAFRKPNPGMLLDASRLVGIDLPRSWMVGDKLLDVQAGLNAGVGGAVLVRTGYGRQYEQELKAGQHNWANVHVAETLGQAVENLILRPTRL